MYLASTPTVHHNTYFLARCLCLISRGPFFVLFPWGAGGASFFGIFICSQSGDHP
jgi:hypothetical protein